MKVLHLFRFRPMRGQVAQRPTGNFFRGRELVLFLPVLLATLVQAADPPRELAVLKEFYHKKVEEVEQRIAEEKIAPLIEKYDAALARLEDMVASGGKLESLVAIRDERARVKSEGDINQEDFADGPPELVNLQKELAAQLERIAEDHRPEFRKLRQTYLEKLKSMKIDFTRAKNVDAALAVDAEIRRVEAKSSALATARADADSEETKDSQREFSGTWELVRPGFDKPLVVNFTRLPAQDVDDDPRYRMEGSSSLAGDYVFSQRKLKKVKEENDPYWDIVWIRRGGDWVNDGSHYTGWKMIRPDEESEGEDE